MDTPPSHPENDPGDIQPGIAATSGRAGLLGLVRLMAIDFSPLRTSREFRLLWAGQVVSFLGSQITYVALQFQVYELTRSSLGAARLLSGWDRLRVNVPLTGDRGRPFRNR